MRRFILIFMLVCAVVGEAKAKKESGEGRYDMLLNLVHHNPGEPLFQTRFTQPTYLKELGYTTQVIKREIQCGVTYDMVAEYAVPDCCAEREWIERHAAALKIQMKQIKDAGLQNIPFTDMLVIPQSLMKKYKKEMVDDYGNISILRERTQQILCAQIDELFWRFPELDGLMIRHGETYLHDTPHHVGGSPARTPEEHAAMINLLREELCVKRGKTLIYRTWDFGRLHTQPALYKATMSQIEPHEKLFISIKHPQGDFNRGLKFNPTIGMCELQQIVEISTNQAGCYGKNAHPYYIGRGVIDGWCEMAESDKKGLRDLYDDPKIKGFWTWTWGDSWGGPYFDNELWIKLNEYVIRQYTLTPKRTEKEIFDDYAMDELKLSKKDAERLRELCLLSEAAVYYGQDTKLFRSNIWFSRDQYFACLQLNGAVKAGVTEMVLQEKHENLQRWYEMEKLSKEIKMQDPYDQEFLEVSTTYGRIKYEIYEQIWIMEMMIAQKEVDGTQIDRGKLAKAISIYDNKFVEWRKLKAAHACCPTLYKDHYVTHTGVPFKENLDKLRRYVISNVEF